VTIDRNDLWGSIAGDVIEFSGAEQQTFYAAHAGDDNDVDCDTGADTVVDFSGLTPGSIIYAVGGGNAASGGVTAGGPLTLATNQFTNYLVLGSGYSGNLSGSASPAFDFTGCDRSVMYAVAVRPENN
jgi:hypothetical protein